VASGTTAANPAVLQSQVANILVQPLEPASIVVSSGVRIFDTNGPLRIPEADRRHIGRLGADPRPYLRVSFGEIDLLPSILKSLKVLIRFSNELLRHGYRPGRHTQAAFRHRRVERPRRRPAEGRGHQQHDQGHHQPERCTNRRPRRRQPPRRHRLGIGRRGHPEPVVHQRR